MGVGPGDVEDFTVSLTSGGGRRSPSTIRGYHLSLRMFCDYVTDARYEWPRQCRDRFDSVPSQVCHEWNTVAHLNEYEGRPARRPLTYGELQDLFDFLDDRVERAAGVGPQGSAWRRCGTRRSSRPRTRSGCAATSCAAWTWPTCDPTRTCPRWGTYGSVHVRYGKAVRGGIPRRRTVLAVPEFDWAIEGLRQWVEQARPLFAAADHPALWVTERPDQGLAALTSTSVSPPSGAEIGLDPALSLHCLRHSYVTHLVEFGYPERFVQEQVGHAYASTTAIYASVSNDFKNKTLQAALSRVYAPHRHSEDQ